MVLVPADLVHRIEARENHSLTDVGEEVVAGDIVVPEGRIAGMGLRWFEGMG